jgi:hypothetical protein
MTCEEYLQEPEISQEHLRSCVSCRTLVEGLSRDLEESSRGAAASVNLADLPLAPWEGAQHRSWTSALAVGLTLAVLAMAGFFFAGVPPLRGFWEGMVGGMFPTLDPLKLLSAISGFVRSAPASFHIFIAFAFIAINVVFYMMLRRAPRGYDGQRG